jgi:tetratricopeptide (TPR) repeat protein
MAITDGATAQAERSAPMIGRDQEVATLQAALERAIETRRCHLAVVIGAAGMGKSRLVTEFTITAADRAEVLRGRCLSYGEGITFWPIAEALRGAAGITDDDGPEEARSKLLALVPPDADRSGMKEALAALIGLSDTSFRLEELYWAARRLLEARAQSHPLILEIEDAHWAEPALLDLIDHLVDTIRDASVLLVCTGRPELAERREAWRSEGDRRASLELGPLPEHHAAALVGQLLGLIGAEDAIGSRIVASAEGNPLFLEQLLSMLIDDGSITATGGSWVATRDLGRLDIPPTITALLAARLDRLGAEGRDVLERGSVIGQVFEVDAVSHLLDGDHRSPVRDTLLTLQAKDFVRPEASTISGEDAFAFRHALIRDAAYGGLLKRTRAELHERFADWLAARVADRLPEYEEIVGYHVEQAYLLRASLGSVDASARALAARAGGHLLAAARRADDRGDIQAGLKLFGRCLELLVEDDPLRLAAMIGYGLSVQDAGDLPGAEAFLQEAATLAQAVGDLPARWKVRLALANMANAVRPGALPQAQLLALGEEAIAELSSSGNDEGLARAWLTVAMAHYWNSQQDPRLAAAERGLEHAWRAGDRRIAARCVGHIAFAMLDGSLPAGATVRRSEELLAQFAGFPRIELSIVTAMPRALAMLGRFDQARDAAFRARSLAEDLGDVWAGAETMWLGGDVEVLAGDFPAAEQLYREAYEVLVRMGEKAMLSTLVVLLGTAAFRQGRSEEALEFSRISEESASVEDRASQMGWRGLRGRVLAGRGQLAEAERLTREAVEISRQTDGIDWQGYALVDLAEVLQCAGRETEAAGALREAIELFDQKENLVSAASARKALARLATTSA